MESVGKVWWHKSLGFHWMYNHVLIFPGLFLIVLGFVIPDIITFFSTFLSYILIISNYYPFHIQVLSYAYYNLKTCLFHTWLWIFFTSTFTILFLYIILIFCNYNCCPVPWCVIINIHFFIINSLYKYYIMNIIFSSFIYTFLLYNLGFLLISHYLSLSLYNSRFIIYSYYQLQF